MGLQEIFVEKSIHLWHRESEVERDAIKYTIKTIRGVALVTILFIFIPYKLFDVGETETEVKCLQPCVAISTNSLVLKPGMILSLENLTVF